MKARTILIIGILFFSVALNAQRFKGGALVGFNASQVDGDSWAGYYKTGLLLGAFVNTDFRDNFGGQLEIKYSGKGASTHPDSPVIQKIKLNYIDIPVIATYRPIRPLQIETGISFNYLYNGEIYDGDWFDIFDYFERKPNKIESSFLVGLNYTFFKSFDFNIRYNYSLMPVRSKYSSSQWGQGAWFNNVISFALYFHFGDREL